MSCRRPTSGVTANSSITSSTTRLRRPRHGHLADSFCAVVTHRLPALLALSEMIWYVSSFPLPSPTTSQPTSHENPPSQVSKYLHKHTLTWMRSIVSLASYHHGTCKCGLISLPVDAGNPRSIPVERPRMTRSPMLTSMVVGLTILWRCLLPCDPLPYRLPLQATKGQLHHSDLSPQHQLQRFHLFRYPP